MAWGNRGFSWDPVMWCSVRAPKIFALFLSLLTIRQMFLHVSCLSPALSLPRQAILSLPCFLIIACALKQTPCRVSPFPCPCQLRAGQHSMACKHRAAQKRHARGWQSSGEEGKAACYFRPLILSVSSDTSPFLVTWWLLLRSTVCVQPESITGFFVGI